MASTSQKRSRSSSPVSECSTGNKVSKSDEVLSELSDVSIEEISDVINEILQSKNLATKKDVDDLNEKINTINTDNSQMKEVLAKNKEDSRRLDEVAEHVLQLSMKNKLIFFGFKVKRGEGLRRFVNMICQQLLNVGHVNIIRAKYARRGHASKSRPIVAEFKFPHEVDKVLRNAYMLKGSTMYIQQELTYAQRYRRRKLLFIRKSLIELRTHNTVYVWKHTLAVNQYRFTWINGKGLFAGPGLDGLPLLNSIFQRDFSPLIHQLLREDEERENPPEQVQ